MKKTPEPVLEPAEAALVAEFPDIQPDFSVDRQLYLQHLAGDPEALTKLKTRVVLPAVKMYFVLARGACPIEECLSNVWIALSRAANRYTAERGHTFWKYAKAFVRGSAKSFPASRKLVRSRDPDDVVMERMPAPEDPGDGPHKELAVIDFDWDTIDLGELRPILDDLLRTLPEKYQQILILRTRDRLNFREIADRLGISVSAARDGFSRAAGKLRLKARYKFRLVSDTLTALPPRPSPGLSR